MIDLDTAVAHAVLERASVLTQDRRTRDARHLLDALLAPTGVSGTLGKVPADAASFSLGALVRERADLRLANLNLKEGRHSTIAEAREALSLILTRVGPEAPYPTLDGQSRMQLLSDLSAALSRSGLTESAIALSEFLIAPNGLPELDPTAIAEHIRETADGKRRRAQITLQLQYNALRRLRLAQLDLLADDNESAGRRLARAELDVRCALTQALEHLPAIEHDRPRYERIIRVRRAVLARVQLEQALLCPPTERRERLRVLRGEIEEIVAETDAGGTTRAAIRLLRHAALAGVICEQALDSEQTGDHDTARRLGLTAYILAAPYVALHETDADELFSYVIRYGRAFRLAGRAKRGHSVVARTRERISLFYGEHHPALKGIDLLLDELRSKA